MLHAAYNRIATMPRLCRDNVDDGHGPTDINWDYRGLRDVDLSHNQITAFPDGIATTLCFHGRGGSIDLSHNQIAYFPDPWDAIEHATLFDFRENPGAPNLPFPPVGDESNTWWFKKAKTKYVEQERAAYWENERRQRAAEARHARRGY